MRHGDIPLTVIKVTVFLLLSLGLFPSSNTRKEVLVFDSFENFVKNIPSRAYLGNDRYEAEKLISDNQQFIKVINDKTLDGRLQGKEFMIPPAYRDSYFRLNEYGFKEHSATKKMIASFVSLDNLFSKRALRIYKSAACETNFYNDTILAFKHIPYLIKVTYFYNQNSDHVYQTIHRIPNLFLDTYLKTIVSTGSITPRQAEQVKLSEEKYLTLKYDYMNRFIDAARERELEIKYSPRALAADTPAPTEQRQFTSYYIHQDANGSVTAVTDKDGKLVERVEYSPYGYPTFWDYTQDPNNPVKRSRSVIDNNILFHGREYDYELNLYYFRNRYYDPIMGRFLQTDPRGYQNSMNLYQAFGMNPVNFVDPFGLAKVIVAGFDAVGGPHLSTNTGALYEQTPTKPGSFVVGTNPFLYSNPYSRYLYSKIPWNTPMRVNKNQFVEFKIGGKWVTIGNITKQDVEVALQELLKDIRKNQPPSMPIPYRINFPTQWVLNDYGHATIAYFDDKNNNGIMDSGERLENDMIHPTPLGELQKALGIPNNQIYLEGSHGCIHVTPDDIDTMIFKGYLKKGSKVVIHSYNEDIPKNWKYDPNGRGPYEVHFFPGKKKMIILGEK